MGKAEEHQERPSLHVLIGERLAVLVLEMEWAADRSDSGADRRRRATRDEKDRAKKQKQSAEKSGEQQHDARCIRLHERCPVSRNKPKSRRGWSRRTPRCRSGPIASQCRRAPGRLVRWRRIRTQKLAVVQEFAACWRNQR